MSIENDLAFSWASFIATLWKKAEKEGAYRKVLLKFITQMQEALVILKNDVENLPDPPDYVPKRPSSNMEAAEK